jgi:radical SAM protein with 4Fe4S-binding SPASM domain
VKNNLGEIPAFVDLAAGVKADHVHFMDLMYLHQGSQALSVFDRADETKQCFNEAIRRAQRQGIRIGSFLTYGTSDYLALPGAKGGCAVNTAPQEWNETAATPCYAPWNSLLMTNDGTVTVCCRAKTVMGNVRKEGLSAIWNGPTYQYFRRRVNTDSPPDDCRGCPVKTGIAKT